MKFEINKWYKFKIEKIISIEKSEDQIILLHDSGRRLLLNATYYVKYNFQLGQEIECRIDKVNCTGQVFLEPRHPFYQEGIEYEFKILEIKEIGYNVIITTIIDTLKNEIQFPVSQKLLNNSSSKLYLKVKEVRKGIPILEFGSNISGTFDHKNSLLEQISDFELVGSIMINRENHYFMYNGNIASLINEKYYKHYNLSFNKKVACYVYNLQSNGLFKVEPINPWYKVGEFYNFNLIRIDEVYDLEGNRFTNAIVYDISKKKCVVKITNDLIDKIKSKDTIRCKVLGFRKGRPQLEIDPEQN